VRTVGPNSILLTTDADAVPARNWIDANLAAIENGVDLVGGYIMGDHHNGRPSRRGTSRSRISAASTRHLHYARLVDQVSAVAFDRNSLVA
jgi:hypothetical protein